MLERAFGAEHAVGVGRSAVFFDFGGTLTNDSARTVVTAEGIAAVKAANAAGHLVVIVSNQKAIAEGRLTPDDLEHIRVSADAAIRAAGAHVDAWYFCQHGPNDGCACRKPSPGMLLAASSDLGIDLHASAIVGDRDDRDVAAGRHVGALTALFEADERSHRGAVDADLADRSLTSLVRAVIERLADN